MCFPTGHVKYPRDPRSFPRQSEQNPGKAESCHELQRNAAVNRLTSQHPCRAGQGLTRSNCHSSNGSPSMALSMRNQTRASMDWPMKRTAPSQKAALTPPG